MAESTFKAMTYGFLLTILIGCGGVSQNQYDVLKAENEKLKKEIEDLKFGPAKLLEQAKIYIDNKDFNSGKDELQNLISKHPTSQQAIEAKQLMILIEKSIEVQRLADEKVIAENLKVEKARLANATKRLRTKYDDIKGITWYFDRGTPVYTNYNSLHLYMGKEKEGKPWLCFRIQYAADDWLFIESYTIKTDNDSYTISTSYGEVKTDNGSGGIWEWYDVALDNRLYNIVKDIIKSKTVKLRHNGKQYFKDRTITDREKQGLQNILDAYDALGGSHKF